MNANQKRPGEVSVNRQSPWLGEVSPHLPGEIIRVYSRPFAVEKA